MPFDAAPVHSPLPDNTAAQTALVLDMVEFYFQGGKRWLHGTWLRGEQRCLLGAIKFVRFEICSDHDQAEYYLARVIAPAERVNDNRARPSGTSTDDQLARKASVAARSKTVELLVSSIVMKFNDTKGRSYSEIAAVLHKAREMAETDASARAENQLQCVSGELVSE